jgi:hypothetical protein
MNMADTEDTTIPTRLTDDSTTWVKACSILKGTREVLDGLRDEIATIRAADPDRMFPKGMGERVALVEALNEVNKSLAADLRSVARTSGLTIPKGLE